MTAARLVTIWCDAEHDPATDSNCELWRGTEDTAAEARQVAKSYGWVRVNGRDLSPTCAKREGVTT